jgi:High-affinity nickel-transport protein
MFGLDDYLASQSDGAGLLVVALVAILLGLRHATDPDHLAALTTLAPSEPGAGRAARLGLAWGSGHGLTLFTFGLPIVLFHAFLPERLQQGAETAVGVMIVALAVWLLVRWRRGEFETASHSHRVRTPMQAFLVGLVHGIGGSAGVGLLLIASINSEAYALVALVLLAAFTAVSMTIVTSGFGSALARAPVARLAPVFGVGGIAFGVWYALGALAIAPYVF